MASLNSIHEIAYLMAQMEQRTRRGTTAMQTKIGISTWFRDAERGLNEIMAHHPDLEVNDLLVSGRFAAGLVLYFTLTSCSDCLCKLLKGWEPARRFSLFMFLYISVLTIYIMMKCVSVCVSVTKNDHFLLGVSCNHLNHP